MIYNNLVINLLSKLNYTGFFRSLIYKPLNGFCDKISLKYEITYSAISEEIINFRAATYSDKASYLLTNEHQNIVAESELDRRSLHLKYKVLGKVSGSVRLVNYPFEISNLIPGFKSEYPDYIEISRLISKNREVTSDFLIFAGNFSQATWPHTKGLIALVPEYLVSRYKMFGFEPVSSEIVVSYRNNKKYFVMNASYEAMGLRALGKIFLK